MYDHLLPSNSTAFEQAASRAMNILPRVASGVAALRTAKLVSIPDSVVPFLIYEYGLGPVSAYVADQRFLLSSGIDWQRVRGTPEAVDRALSWLSYAAEIEEAPTRRRRWNLFQLALSRVRDVEEPDLENIEGVVGLSVAVRSQFYRGFRGYDVREMEWSRRRWSGARWSGSSGVRLRADGAKWSFGRPYDFSIDLDQTQLEALGAWVDPQDVGTLGWGVRAARIYQQSDVAWGDFSWMDTDASWDFFGEVGRLNAICAALTSRPVWVAFRAAGGALIGYRRARVVRSVLPSAQPDYTVNGLGLSASEAGTSVYIEALTDFGQGFGQQAATVSLVFDAAPVSTMLPGLQWAVQGQLTAGLEVFSRPAQITFGRTVRERVRYHLKF